MISHVHAGKAMVLVIALTMGSTQLFGDASENFQEVTQIDTEKASREELSLFDWSSAMLISGGTGIMYGYLSERYHPFVAMMTTTPVMLLGYLYQKARCGTNDSKYRAISNTQVIGTAASALIFMYTWHQLRTDLAYNMALMMAS